MEVMALGHLHLPSETRHVCWGGGGWNPGKSWVFREDAQHTHSSSCTVPPYSRPFSEDLMGIPARQLERGTWQAGRPHSQAAGLQRSGTLHSSSSVTDMSPKGSQDRGSAGGVQVPQSKLHFWGCPKSQRGLRVTNKPQVQEEIAFSGTQCQGEEDRTPRTNSRCKSPTRVRMRQALQTVRELQSYFEHMNPSLRLWLAPAGC